MKPLDGEAARRGWIAVDLDGTLAEYEGWVSEIHIGQPIPEMLNRVRKWLEMGLDVRIFTARVSEEKSTRPESFTARRAIENWCEFHLGQMLPVTNEKDFGMIALWDDRCITVEHNTGRILSQGISKDWSP